MTTTQYRPISATGVSRALAKRENRSESHATMVRGYHSATQGFIARNVRSRGTDAVTEVRVEWESGSGVWHPDEADRQAAALTRYTPILTAAGYTVVRLGDRALSVTKRVEVDQ